MKACKKWIDVRRSADTRPLRNGKTRLRFRLSPEGLAVVEHALELAQQLSGASTKGDQLDIIAMSYLSGCHDLETVNCPTEGRERLLIRLFPDQYRTVRLALNQARSSGENDTAALFKLAELFLLTEAN